MTRTPIAVVGAGLIGRTHIDRALKQTDVDLVGIADPSEQGRAVAEAVSVPWFPDFDQMLEKVRPRGVVIATPNATHARIAVHCLERGLAVLIEKPVADTLEDAQRICEASTRTALPVLVGHQRRHNPIMRRAKEIIGTGRIGQPVCLTAMSTWLKPAEYFGTEWRRVKGGGPILINLIHDVDQLRFLFGDIESVQAMASNRIRGFEVEDTVTVLFRFRNGALGTVTVSDTAAAPWNWDLAAGEAERFPRQDVNSHFLSGTDGSLTLPRLEFWQYREGKGWHDELTEERTALHFGDPYAEQMRHFRAVVEGQEEPLCSAADAMRSLEATLAVATAANSGHPVELTSWESARNGLSSPRSEISRQVRD
jgi:predicted dehydrogenase